jgi:putative ABC transport system permease protein
MTSIGKTPLAWKNLTHDKRRLAVAIAGIAFAVLLMFTQVGFQNALFDSQAKLIDELQGELFIVSKAKFTLAAEKRIPLARLHQAQSVSGVAGAYPLYSELTTSVLRKIESDIGNKGFPIRSLGFQLNDPIFKIPTINAQRTLLREPHTALIDKKSKQKKFAFVRDNDALLATDQLELANQRLKLVGTFELGTDFAHDGNLVMSAENFAHYYPHRKHFGDPLSVIDIGIIQLQPHADLEATRRLLLQVLSKDVQVFTRAQFRAAEVSFWDESTPIGTIFLFGKIIGFIVGMVICYQVIYSDITDHMPEFATLKAMGYPASYFVRLIVTEALLLAVVGFLPGTLVSRLLYGWLAGQTGLLMTMTLDCLLFVLLATIIMCVASGLLALRKLLAADPASLF